MQQFFSNVFSSFGVNDILDIAITTFIIYKILEFIKETRAQQLFRGLIILIAAYFVSGFLNLHMIHWILGGAFTVGLFALVVLFQPELRRGLEHMGRSRIGKNKSVSMDREKAKYVTDELVQAVKYFSENKIGTLIVMEQEITLEDIAETGTILDADITARLLENLFYEGSPLHDGAVLVRYDKIYAAGCVLPLTENKNVNESLGTRHRAGIGITENSDAIAIIVSEESGIISIAQEGRIRRFLEAKNIEKVLLKMYAGEDGQDTAKVMKRIGKKIIRRDDVSE